MHKSHTGLIAAAVFAVGSLSGANAAPGTAVTPPDSFVPVPASNVHALVHQIETNPIIRQRYAKQLHLPEQRVAAYLQANLVKSRLRTGERYTMYCVRPNGLVYPTVMEVPRGSTVFALRGGPAVMTYPNGNPLKPFGKVVVFHYVPMRGSAKPIVNVSPSQQMIAPVQGQEIVVPAYVPVTVYQATSATAPGQPTDVTPSSPAQP